MAQSGEAVSYAELERRRVIPDADRKPALQELVAQMRRTGRGKPYDCVIGVSGGVDSTYLLAAGVDCLGDRCVGATAVSPSLASEELDAARRIAAAARPCRGRLPSA